MLARTEFDWKQLLKDHYAVLFKNEKGEFDGYMIYSFIKDTSCFEVHEIMYGSYETLKGLLAFIYIHNPQLNNVKIKSLKDKILLDVLSNPRIDVKVEPFMMSRIIDVRKAVIYYLFLSSGNFIFEVSDTMGPWNEGCFELNISKDHIVSTQKLEGTVDTDFKIDVKELTQLILGFRTFEELLELEAIQLTNSHFDHTKFFLPKTIPNGLYDYF